MADIKAKQDAAISDAVSTVLMGIITFLVILLTYKWFRSNIGATQTDKKKSRTTEQNQTETTTAKGDASKPSSATTQPSKPCTNKLVDSDEEDSTNIDDVLVKASDIKPLDQETLDKMQKMTESTEELSAHKPHVKAKELEEEVAKSLSDAQLEEETKVRENQLAAIFKLMEDNKDRFGVDNMNDVQEQYKLYV